MACSSTTLVLHCQPTWSSLLVCVFILKVNEGHRIIHSRYFCDERSIIITESCVLHSQSPRNFSWLLLCVFIQ